MYQVHQTDWLGVGFVVCIGLVAALAALVQFGKVKLPNYVFVPPIGIAILLILTMSWLRMSDDRKLRAELQGFNPLAVSNVVVSTKGARHQLVETNTLISVFNQLQQVQVVPAHHSYPVDSYNFGFTFRGLRYLYRMGRDSDRADEYWVFETARAGLPGREIGRIHSSTLGQLLNSVTHEPTPSKP